MLLIYTRSQSGGVKDFEKFSEALRTIFRWSPKSSCWDSGLHNPSGHRQKAHLSRTRSLSSHAVGKPAKAGWPRSVGFKDCAAEAYLTDGLRRSLRRSFRMSFKIWSGSRGRAILGSCFRNVLRPFIAERCHWLSRDSISC